MLDAPRPAVVLLSGGLDSATALAIAKDQGFAPHALSFRYGQRHLIELEAAARVAEALGAVEHRVVAVDLGGFGGSALTADIAVPKHRDAADIGQGIPLTYVPARNTVFLSLALAWAEVLGAIDIFIGVNALDYSGYPDCRPEFIAAFERMANLATRAGVQANVAVKQRTSSPVVDLPLSVGAGVEAQRESRSETGEESSAQASVQCGAPSASAGLGKGGGHLRVHTPLIEMTKAEIIRRGTALGVDYGLTFSCYDPPDGLRPCGGCDACLLRAKGFAEAGLNDPLLAGE